MTGKKWCEVSACRNRTNTRAASTVRDAEGLVQVEVANVTAELAELCVSDHRIGVCAVDVNLTTGFVNSVTNVDDGFFINAVG